MGATMKFSLIPKGVLSILLAVCVPGAALADSAADASDAKARTVLRQMTDYLAEMATRSISCFSTLTGCLPVVQPTIDLFRKNLKKALFRP